MAAAAALALAVGAAAGWRGARVALEGPADPGSLRLVRVVVRPGMTAADVARLLRRDGVIRRAWSFRLLARWRRDGGRLEAGTYLLGPGMSTGHILQVIATGRVAVVPVTIPEGWTADQVAAALAAHGLGTAAAARAAVDDARALAAARLPAPAHGARHALEGYLFPATYEVPYGSGPVEAVAEMLQRFRVAWSPALAAAARRNAGLNTERAVTLASIVQAEVADPAAMRLVAAVYLNRLRARMDLDADPTVLYGLGRLGLQRDLLTAAELRSRSPYNTYAHAGLPPGPICNPGLAALRAVAYPARLRALYFLTTRTGRVVVADTLAQQLENERRYLGS